MLSRETLKERLTPIIESAGMDPDAFATNAIPIMQEHMRGIVGSIAVEEAFDVWNDVVSELVTHCYSTGVFKRKTHH